MNIRIGDISIHYRLDGTPGAPWLVFSNSHCTTLALWDELVPRFADRYRILRYDIRGHGATSAPQGDYRSADLVADLIGLFDALKIERAHLCGISIGGQTGFGAAIQHPERLLSLTAANARSFVSEAVAKSWQERIDFVAQRGTAAIAEPTVSRWFEPGFYRDHPQTIERIRAMIRATSKQGYIGCARAIQTLDYRAELPSIRVPTLLLSGMQDSSATVDMVRSVQAAIPGAELLMLDPAGHLSVAEQPQAFGDALAAFLAKH